MKKYFQSFVLHILANIAGLYLVDYLVTDFCVVADKTLTACPTTPEWHTLAFITGAVVLALVNAIIKPVLKFVTLPFVFLSMGLFMFVVNAIVFWTVVWTLNTLDLSGVHILVTGTAWVAYLYAAVVLGLFNLCTHWLTDIRD